MSFLRAVGQEPDAFEVAAELLSGLDAFERLGLGHRVAGLDYDVTVTAEHVLGVGVERQVCRTVVVGRDRQDRRALLRDARGFGLGRTRMRDGSADENHGQRAGSDADTRE